jgi:hypothetical protein
MRITISEKSEVNPQVCWSYSCFIVAFLEQQLGNFSRNVPRGFNSLPADIGLQRQFHVIDTAASSRVFQHPEPPELRSPDNNLPARMENRKPVRLAAELSTSGSAI